MLPVAARGVPTLLSGYPATLAADDLPISDIAVSRSRRVLLGGLRSGLGFVQAGTACPVATAAFMVWGRRGRTVRSLTFSRCTAELLYHRGSGPSLAGASGGRGSVDVLCDRCHAVSGGRRPEAVPAELYQSGF